MVKATIGAFVGSVVPQRWVDHVILPKFSIFEAMLACFTFKHQDQLGLNVKCYDRATCCRKLCLDALGSSQESNFLWTTTRLYRLKFKLKAGEQTVYVEILL